jgi:hypothetical protein
MLISGSRTHGIRTYAQRKAVVHDGPERVEIIASQTAPIPA